jgi:hypothetical protein
LAPQSLPSLRRNGLTYKISSVHVWILVLIAVPIWISLDQPGWDLAVYRDALRSLSAGHDPYADAIAVQNFFHSQIASHSHTGLPYSYVYSPITLPLLRLIAPFPLWLSGGAYLLVYVAAILAQLWVGVWTTSSEERRFFLFVAPIAPFFPGLLANGIILGGNVAYILYAAVLLSAILGWKRGSWTLFYVVTLVASCVKAPLLSLALIPVLSSRKQWLATSVTVAVGVFLFAVQSVLWPTLFSHYLEAVQLQFVYNHDFGCSPAGLVSDFVYDHGLPYSRFGLAAYLSYALPILAILFYLSRRFLDDRFSLKQWVPVLLVGIVLLNPRLIEYDVAPLTIPLALICWRILERHRQKAGLIPCLAVLYFACNIVSVYSWHTRKFIDGPMLVILFLLGSWDLLRRSKECHQRSRVTESDYAPLLRSSTL